MGKKVFTPVAVTGQNSRPFRVTYYANFSFEEDPLEIKKATVKLETFVARQPHWTLVSMYIDSDQFNSSSCPTGIWNGMMRDAKDNLFDLVVTPDLAHFAASAFDASANIEAFHALGIGVFFLDKNICSFDSDIAIQAYLETGIANDETKVRSSRIKAGLQKKVNDGHVLGNDRIYGYRKDNGRLVIDEQEAEMIRQIYCMYATGLYSFRELADTLYKQGFRSRSGNKISHVTLANVIKNPKYKGSSERISVPNANPMFRVHHPPIRDDLTNTNNTIPAIVSEEQWDSANAVLAQRNEQIKSRQAKENDAHLFTGKLFCAHCNTPYYRREYLTKAGVRVTKWLCSGKIKLGASSCLSFAIEERKLSQAILRVFEAIKDENDQWLKDYTLLLNKISNTDTLLRRIDKIDRRIDTVNKKKQRLLSYNVSNKLDDQEYLNMNSQLSAELEELSANRGELIRQYNEAYHRQQRIEEIKSIYAAVTMSAAEGVVTRAFIEKYIERIDVAPNGDGRTATLEITIFSGESFSYGISSD